MDCSKFKALVVALGVVALVQACDSSSSGGAKNNSPELNEFAFNVGDPDRANCSVDSVHNIVSASSDADFDANYRPANVIDGNLSTESRWSSNGVGRTVTLDLGSSELVRAVRTAWYKGDVREAYFEVQTSRNGSAWNTVLADAVVTGTQDLVTFVVAESEARYVRIVGNGNSDSSWTSLIEAEVLGCASETPAAPAPENPQACSANDNLKIVRATTVDDFDTNYRPSNAIDGNLNTESRWSSNGVGRSLVLDLGSSSSVREISTAWYRADEREAFFDVRTSTDNRNWTTVLSQATAIGTEGMINFDVNDSIARYVEIIGLGNSNSNWSSLIEVDVFGCGTVDNTTPVPQPEPEPVEPVVVPPPPPGPGNSDPVNVVFNGTFENNLSGWSQVEPAQGSSDAFEGSGSGKISSSGALSQSIFVVPQSRYRVSAYLQGDPTLGIRVNGRTFTADGPDNGGSYAQVSFEFDTGSASTVELFVRASSSSDSARADSIEMIRISGGNGATPIDPNDVFDFSIWDVEGESPVTREGTLRFDSLDQCVVTPNGNGCRHEVKVIENERFGLTDQYEFFSANIQADLSPGAETIVVQHHPEETGTLAALYLTDTADAYPGVQNGIARDGVFDVVVTVRIPGRGRDNEARVLGTVRAGQSFDYEVINDHGEMVITAFGSTIRLQSADSSASFLKFGNYMQARDPVTRVRMELNKPLGAEDRQPFLDYYRSRGITRSVLVFRNVVYSRTID